MHPSPDRQTSPAGDADIVPIAVLIGDPTRARMLSQMLDGSSHPASSLAAAAGVSKSSASAHLTKLVNGGLVGVRREGRYRLHHLSGPAVADLLEAMAALAPRQQVRSLRQHNRAAAMRSARSCYDHLAGELGVKVTQTLRTSGALRFEVPPDHTLGPSDSPVRLGRDAATVFDHLGVDLDGLLGQASRRPLARICIDSSERQPHLAGRLGAAVLTVLITKDWVRRHPTDRGLDITVHGRERIAEFL